MRSLSDGRDGLPHRASFLRSLLGQDTRMDIMYDVLAHPQHAPSLVELTHSMKYTDPRELRVEVEKLVEYDILKRVTYEGDDAPEDAPTEFYTLTDGGWATIRFFNEQFTPQVYERLSEAYEGVMAQAPEEVKRAGDAPRPNGGSSGE